MDNISKVIETVKVKIPSIYQKLDESMKNHTSFRIGGNIRVMYLPKSIEELKTLCCILHSFEIMPLIIGCGTNLLVDDRKPLEMIAVKTTGINAVRVTGETEITAEAGISLAKLADFAYEHELTGLEYAHGIPGSLGGAVSMNAGAYGSEMKDTVYSTCVCCRGNQYIVTGTEHRFSYRSSRFSDTTDIILSSALRLQKGDKRSIKIKMDELHARRAESQPLDLPSAGSTFKRPKDGYAAALIQQAGLQGFSIGGAQISLKHSGFVVNNGEATFMDVISIVEHVKETVFRKFSVELEPEIKIVS